MAIVVGNRVIAPQHAETSSQRAMRRLRDPASLIQVVNKGNGPVQPSVSNFVVDTEHNTPDLIYVCQDCYFYLIVSGCRVAGAVCCACGKDVAPS